MGYNKITLKEGLNLLGAQFVPVGQQNKTLVLSDLTNMTDQPSYERGKSQTQLRFWNGGGYDTYGWSGAFSVENEDDAQEMVDDGDLENITDLDYKWLSGFDIADDIPAATTEGFWLYAKEAGTITISGEVPSTNAQITVQLAAGLNMVAVPWPVNCKLKNINVPNQPSYERGKSQTQLRFWNGGGYDTYGWSGAFSVENEDDAQEMVDDGDLENITDLDYKWLSGFEDASDEVVPLGQGFWIYAKEEGSVIFTFEK